MSKSANKTLIGAFVVGALSLLGIAIAVFGSGKLFQETEEFVLFFDKSVSGLSNGSPVVFRGVPVGRVDSIRLEGSLETMKFITPVYISLDTKKQSGAGMSYFDTPEYFDKLVTHGLRARLAPQSFVTGQLMVELDFFPPSESGPPIKKSTLYDGMLVIPTIPSKMDSVWHKFSTLPIDDISNNILELTQTMNSIFKLSSTKQMMEHADSLVTGMQNFMEEATQTMVATRTLIKRYDQLGDSADRSLVETVMKVGVVLENMTNVVSEVERTVSAVRGVMGQNSVTVLELNKTLREIAEAARAVRGLSTTLDRNPEVLLRGKGNRQ